eukprot:c8462_g1_i1.p1 GENE.c8462_g1_i1~~c8462_g1_i1.p1  ORF type:complete len:485 (-),score=142.03 c8462_g1_i1:448-1869(-)
METSLGPTTRQTWIAIARAAEDQGDHTHAALCFAHVVLHFSCSGNIDLEALMELFKNLIHTENPAKVLEAIGLELPQLIGETKRLCDSQAQQLQHDQQAKQHRLHKCNDSCSQYANHNHTVATTPPHITLGFCLVACDRLIDAHIAFRAAVTELQHAKETNLPWGDEERDLVLLGMGVMYFKHNSLEQAKDVLKRCVHSRDFCRANEAAYFLGLIHKRQLKRILALECFNSILDNAPAPLTRVDILFEIAQVHELHNEPKLAKHMYQQIVGMTQSDDKQRAKALARYGWVCGSSKSLRTLLIAQESIENALAIDGDDVVSWVMLVRVLERAHNTNKAFAICQHAIGRHCASGLLWCELGSLYFHANHFEEAAASYERATQLDISLGEAWFNLAIALQQLSQLQQASAALDQAHAVNVHPYINKHMAIVRRLIANEARGDNTTVITQPLVICLTIPQQHTRFVPMPNVPIPSTQ